MRSIQGQMRIQNGCGEVEKPKNQQHQLKARHSGSRSQIHDLRVTGWQREKNLRQHNQKQQSLSCRQVLRKMYKYQRCFK